MRFVGGRKSRGVLVASLATLMVSAGMLAPATAANAASKPKNNKGPGTIEVCKSSKHGMAGQSFQFSLNGGAPFTVKGGACSGPMVAPPGHNTVVEAPTAGLEVAKIKATKVISSNLSTGTVVVNVKTGSTPQNETLVTYFNEALPAVGLKVCKVAANVTLQGQLFSFTENGGPAYSVEAGTAAAPICGPVHPYPLNTLVNVAELATPNTHVSGITVSDARGSNVNTAAGTVTATIGAGVTVVTYTNDLNPIGQTGFVEVCKYTANSDPFVTGSFNFTITDSAGATIPQSVLVGQCTAPIQVAAGNVTITEAAQFPYFLEGVDVFPSSQRFVSGNLANQTVTVTVPAGDSSTETAVAFYNATLLGNYKICKTLSPNSTDLAGKTFYFDVQDAWDLTGVTKDVAKPNQISGNYHIDAVVAGAAGTTTCIIDQDSVPLGSTVSIAEEATPNVQTIGVSVSPAANDLGSVAPEANLKISSGITTATFTNEAFGTLEICKTAADPETATQSFQFSVNSGTPITVHANQCSQPIAVPAGQASVFELGSTNFHLVTVSVSGGRFVSGTNPVVVSTPYGGVANETVVTFTNAVNTGQFKICKVSTEPTLQGVPFTFDYGYTVDNTPVSGKVTLVPGTCSALSADIPVVDPQGNPITIGASEEAVAGVAVSQIDVANGTVIGTTPSTEGVTFSVNQGFTTVTFTNVRTPVGPTQ